jgi:hypothetical protein
LSASKNAIAANIEDFPCPFAPDSTLIPSEKDKDASEMFIQFFNVREIIFIVTSLVMYTTIEVKILLLLSLNK